MTDQVLKQEDDKPAQPVRKQEQASLALANLVSRGVPLKEARKRLGIK